MKQFGVGAVILSSELDAKSRQNAVLQFNKGKYDVLIANDQADIDEEIVEGENEKVTFSAIRGPTLDCVTRLLDDTHLSAIFGFGFNHIRE